MQAILQSHSPSVVAPWGVNWSSQICHKQESQRAYGTAVSGIEHHLI